MWWLDCNRWCGVQCESVNDECVFGEAPGVAELMLVRRSPPMNLPSIHPRTCLTIPLDLDWV